MSTIAVSKSERAYTAIKQSITEGVYGPGYRLVLGQIAKELDVSVVPVREAIRRLEAEGLVTFTTNVGAQVVAVDAREYRFTMETLSLVEGLATAMAAPHVSADDLALARKINEEMRACLNNFDPTRFTELNHEFHAVFFEHCSNLHILDLVHRGWNRLATIRESSFGYIPGRAQESVEEHDKLVSLIAGGADALTIEMAARAHRLATLNAYLDSKNTPSSTRSSKKFPVSSQTLRKEHHEVPQ